MNKDTLINIRVNKKLKEAFQSIIEPQGYTMSDLLEATMRDVVKRGFIPINLRSRLPVKYENVLSIPDIKRALEESILNMEGKNKIKNASLFGSYAKGEATRKSDVDIFVDVDNGFTLFEMGDLQEKLEKRLGKKVDIVTNSNNEYLMNHIQREKIQLYERRT